MGLAWLNSPLCKPRFGLWEAHSQGARAPQCIHKLTVVRGIPDDMRDPRALLSLCHRQIVDKKAERMLAALEGTWKEEHLFALRQAYEEHETLRRVAGPGAGQSSKRQATGQPKARMQSRRAPVLRHRPEGVGGSVDKALGGFDRRLKGRRGGLVANLALARKLAELERKYDSQFKIVFDAIRELMRPPETPRKRIGYHAKD